MKRMIATVAAIAIASAAASEQPKNTPPADAAKPIRCVLVVQNRTPCTTLPMGSLADALTAKLSGTRFSIVNPANVIGVTQNRTASGEVMPEVSATELATALGADALLTASVIELLEVSTPFTHQYTIRMAINLANAQSGANVCGKRIERSSPKYTFEQIKRNSRKYLGDLLYAAADECAELLEKNTPQGAFPRKAEPAPQVAPPPVVGTTPKPPFPRPGRPAQSKIPTITELDNAIGALIARMQQDDLFVKNYAAAKSAASRQPIVVLGDLEDKTGTDGDSIKIRLNATLATLRVSLFQTRLFEVKDDEASVALAKRIVAGGDSPLENGELMALLKTHDSPDFFVLGDMRRFDDDGAILWRLRLAVHNLATGKIVWEGIQQIEK